MSKNFSHQTLLEGNSLRFQKYGVKIEVRAAKAAHLKEIGRGLEKNFPNGLDFLGSSPAEYVFVVGSSKSGREKAVLELYLNGEKLFEDRDRENFFEFAESRIRLTVAEFASGKVFLHAGVVGWRGKAFIFPGTSFSGKTTLVAELVRRGAEYFSDEYAVVDAEGDIEPFPKWLSMRGIVDEYKQIDRPVEAIGGIAAARKLAPGLILFSRYQKTKKNPKRWSPKKLKPGEAIMEILPHTIPIRNNPKFVLEVLNKLTNRAIIVRTVRGEAAEFAEHLLGYFESHSRN